jgi:hypothetical protein
LNNLPPFVKGLQRTSLTPSGPKSTRFPPRRNAGRPPKAFGESMKESRRKIGDSIRSFVGIDRNRWGRNKILPSRRQPAPPDADEMTRLIQTNLDVDERVPRHCRSIAPAPCLIGKSVAAATVEIEAQPKPPEKRGCLCMHACGARMSHGPQANYHPRCLHPGIQAWHCSLGNNAPADCLL